LPKAVVLRTLEDALAKDSCTLLREVAASLGLRTIRRFYAEQRSSELAHVIAAKNAKIKKRSHDVANKGLDGTIGYAPRVLPMSATLPGYQELLFGKRSKTRWQTIRIRV
jgi:hypothetical protein